MFSCCCKTSELDTVTKILGTFGIPFALERKSKSVSSELHVFDQADTSSVEVETIAEAMNVDNEANVVAEKARKVYVVECDLCGKPFKFTIHLNEHRRNIHEQNEPSHICSYCGSRFNKKSNLTRHVKKFCVKNHSYICNHCSKTFPSEHVMMKHKCKI